jgi:electron transfer flavoprotein alpha subunit
LQELGNYGITKVYHIQDSALDRFDSQNYTTAVSAAFEKANSNTLVFSHNYSSKSIGPRMSAKFNAGMAVNVVALPTKDGADLKMRRTVFSGKAFADVVVRGEKKIIAIQSNSFEVEVSDSSAIVESLDVDFSAASQLVEQKEIKKETGKVSLVEASIVVSAGRGLKGPENWGMVEEMADILDAATACSKPVSDMGWRSHSEHVGQTGITVRPNLYFAIGISGAIQHLAGVNGSKCIIAINTDPEAPIFKAADYGIVGDAFQVVPELNSALKELLS